MSVTLYEKHVIIESIRRVLSTIDTRKLSIPTVDAEYLRLIYTILRNGYVCENRTGINTTAIPSYNFGSLKVDDTTFPLISTKTTHMKSIAVELEGFIKGIIDKSWYTDRKCNIWNEWHNPKSEDTNDLGKIYGYQWNNFNGVNQLEILMNKLKNNPQDRRMMVSAWNPSELDEMALPPCHYGFLLNYMGGKLHLVWDQRSVDTMLGLPFNIASYALLLKIICNVTGYVPGTISGSLKNVHIYENHMEGILEYIMNISDRLINQCNLPIPTVNITRKLDSIYDFNSLEDYELLNYNPLGKVKFDVAV